MYVYVCVYIHIYVYTYKKHTNIFFGKKLYFEIEIGNVIDLLHLVLQGISMEAEFIFLWERLFFWRSFMF